MSNGLLLNPLKTSPIRIAFRKTVNHQIRNRSVKKFPVPPSFHSHLHINNRRKKPKDGSDTGPRLSTDGQTPARMLEATDDAYIQVLDNSVERQLDQVARQEFGMNMEPIIEQFCGHQHHPEIAWFMRGYVSRARLADEQTVRMLWDALRNYLPEDPLNKDGITSPRGNLTHFSFTFASPSKAHPADTLRPSVNRMNLGWYLIMFNQPIIGQSLLFDGTDSRFVPGPSTVWKHRLWAGGSINLQRMFAEPLPTPSMRHLVESPVGLRIVGTNMTPEKLFVTVRKRVYDVIGRCLKVDYNLPGLVRHLKKEPTFHPGKSITQTAGPWIEETYTLCFLRDPPNLATQGTATRVIAPAKQPKFSHSLTPDRHLLFCWSALTYNAHRIHLDQAFAQKEYGAADLVVHGPLTLLLVLEWFQRQITLYALERQLSRFHLKSIDYKILAPMYVDQSMRLCTKPTKFQIPGSLADSWEVWVEKDLEGGSKTMTFKGTIKLRVETGSFDTTGRYQVDLPSRSMEKSTSREDGEAAEEFKSPFF